MGNGRGDCNERDLCAVMCSSVKFKYVVEIYTCIAELCMSS